MPVDENYLSENIGTDIIVMRKKLELATLEPKIRVCLKCSKKFESASSSNRFCYNCKKSKAEE